MGRSAFLGIKNKKVLKKIYKKANNQIQNTQKDDYQKQYFHFFYLLKKPATYFVTGS